jgi:hypothetical protein
MHFYIFVALHFLFKIFSFAVCSHTRYCDYVFDFPCFRGTSFSSLLYSVLLRFVSYGPNFTLISSVEIIFPTGGLKKSCKGRASTQ